MFTYEPHVHLWVWDTCCPAGQCFIIVVKVQVAPITGGKREDTYQRVSWLTAYDGPSMFYDSMKLISRVVAASLGIIRSGIVITRRDSTHRVCGCSCLLTFAVTYPIIIQYRTKTTSCQSFNWLSTWNLWARAWRKIVHHQGILTGWKSKTPLEPGCMTLVGIT